MYNIVFDAHLVTQILKSQIRGKRNKRQFVCKTTLIIQPTRNSTNFIFSIPCCACSTSEPYPAPFRSLQVCSWSHHPPCRFLCFRKNASVFALQRTQHVLCAGAAGVFTHMGKFFVISISSALYNMLCTREPDANGFMRNLTLG